jgi:hypothetical protein
MDRLAAYYHWDDEQALEQAPLVAHRNEVKPRRDSGVVHPQREEEVSRLSGQAQFQQQITWLGGCPGVGIPSWSG